MKFPAAIQSRLHQLSRRSRLNLFHLGLFLAVAVIVTAAFLFRDNLTLGQVGYAGVALTAIIASAGLVVPAPALAVVCTGGILLTPWLVALIAGTCEGAGETHRVLPWPER